MKILIADKLSDRVVSELSDDTTELIFQPELTAETLPQSIGDANILVVRSTKVSAETIAAGEQLSVIIRAGAGVNTIDMTAASLRGIYVANCPGKNSAAVAELAIGLLIACDRRLVDACSDLRNGAWRKKEYGKSQGLLGRTLGVIGLGMIGRAVAERAQGLGMNVIAWSRRLTPELAKTLGVTFAKSPLDVATAADAVTLHLAKTAETEHLVDASFLSAMKDGAILINTSRGELIDTAALKTAIAEKQLRVGLDVFENEPSGGQADFLETELASQITATPHIGASTEEASDAIADEVIRIVHSFRETGKPLNTVNLCERTPATHSLVIRHFNRVGVLAGVLDLLRKEGVNVEEMENIIFDGTAAACCTLQLDTAPSATALDRLKSDQHILQVTLKVR